MDLFDWIDVVKQLREQNLTQEQIGEKIGWSRGKVSNYFLIIDKLATDILKITRQYQNGRVVDNATNVAFNFTEGWFRNSGLYDLNKHNQLKLMSNFIDDKFNWSSSKVQQESAKYKLWQQFEGRLMFVVRLFSY